MVFMNKRLQLSNPSHHVVVCGISLLLYTVHFTSNLLNSEELLEIWFLLLYNSYFTIIIFIWHLSSL